MLLGPMRETFHLIGNELEQTQLFVTCNENKGTIVPSSCFDDQGHAGATPLVKACLLGLINTTP